MNLFVVDKLRPSSSFFVILLEIFFTFITNIYIYVWFQIKLEGLLIEIIKKTQPNLSSM